jgi:HEAT repeat protein
MIMSGGPSPHGDGEAPAKRHRGGMDGTISTPRDPRRSVAWILWSAAAACATPVLALVLWTFLPRWCPEWVARWSPWVDPALRAAAAARGNEALYLYYERLLEWGSGAAPRLERTLASGTAAERRVAALGLGQISRLSPTSVAALVAAMHDRDPQVRTAAVAVLDRHAAPELGLEFIRMVRNDDGLLDEPNLGLSLRNLIVVDGLGVARIEELIAIAREPRPRVRERALNLLAGIDLPAARLAVVGALDDLDRGVRRSAIDLCGSAQLEWAVAPLKAMFDAPDDADLRMRVVRALGAIGAHAALPVIIRACSDPVVEVRRAAVASFGALHDGSRSEVLLQLARDTDAQVATLARQVMAALRVSGSEDFFIAELSHPEAGRRADAIRALVSLQGAGLIDLLVARARDGDAGIRSSVARGLGGCGDPRAVTPLLAMLDDPDCLVRWNAALAAGQYVDPRIADALLAGLEAGRFQPDAQALGRSKSPDQDPARWHNAVLEALAVQDLSDAQRRRMPAPLPVPPAAEGLALPPQADVAQPIPQVLPMP